SLNGPPPREPLFGLFPPANGFGPRLPLSVHNGEEVEVTAAGAKYRIRVFDNRAELALARRIDGIISYSAYLAPVLEKGSTAERDEATKRLRMANTALTIG